MAIPLVDVHSQYAPLKAELEARFSEVLDDGQFIRGPHFYAFQEEAAAYLGVKRAVGVANGTDALVLALDALEIGPGDEVICPAFTFYATAESIARWQPRSRLAPGRSCRCTSSGARSTSSRCWSTAYR